MFSITGIQNYIFRLENIVSMAAYGSLAIFVYQDGTALNGNFYRRHGITVTYVQVLGTQNLRYILMDTHTKQFLQKDQLPLKNNTQLTWLGFSETLVRIQHE